MTLSNSSGNTSGGIEIPVQNCHAFTGESDDTLQSSARKLPSPLIITAAHTLMLNTLKRQGKEMVF
jgi:hypothetical protein